MPEVLMRYLNDPDAERAARVQQAMTTMVRIDIEELERAYRG